MEVRSQLAYNINVAQDISELERRVSGDRW